MSGPGPLLLYRPGGLGALIVTLPAIRLVRRAHPGRTAILAASPGPGRLLVGAGAADRLLAVDDPRLSALFAPAAESALPLRSQGFLPGSFWAWLLREPPPELRQTLAGSYGSEGRIMVHEPASGLPLNREFFGWTAAALGLAVSDDAFEDAARLGDPGPPGIDIPRGPFAVLHPGSGSSGKNAPFEAFLDAASELAGRGMEGFLVLGPAEEALRAEPAGRRLPGGWRRLLEPRLEELAGLLARCSAYVGNDSGVTHLAAAAGAPVLALFRSEHLPAWRPCGRTAILSASDPGLIPGAALRDALARFPAPPALQYRP